MNIIDKDIDTATSEFIVTLHDAASATIPKIQLRRKRSEKSWITADLKRNIRKRDQLFKLTKETQTDAIWARWRYQRNMVTSINRLLKTDHLQRQVERLLAQRQNPAKNLKTLREITGRTKNDIPPILGPDGDVLTDDQDKATLLVDHFASNKSQLMNKRYCKS